MLAKKYIVPLNIDIHASWYLRFFLIAIHSLSLLILLLVSIPMWIKCLLSIFTFISLIYCLRRYALLVSTDSVIKIIWQESGWQLLVHGGQAYHVSLQAGSYISSCLISLKFINLKDRKRFTVPILWDAVDRDVMRGLIVWLKTFSQ